MIGETPVTNKNGGMIKKNTNRLNFANNNDGSEGDFSRDEGRHINGEGDAPEVLEVNNGTIY